MSAAAGTTPHQSTKSWPLAASSKADETPVPSMNADAAISPARDDAARTTIKSAVTPMRIGMSRGSPHEKKAMPHTVPARNAVTQPASEPAHEVATS